MQNRTKTLTAGTTELQSTKMLSACPLYSQQLENAAGRKLQDHTQIQKFWTSNEAN